MRPNKPAALLVISLLGSAAAYGSPRAEPAPRPAATKPTETGEALWTRYSCYACHGYQAQGAATGPRIRATTMPYESFEAIVRRPYGVMPAFSHEVLSEARLRSIYAYLGTVGRFDKSNNSR